MTAKRSASPRPPTAAVCGASTHELTGRRGHVSVAEFGHALIDAAAAGPRLAGKNGAAGDRPLDERGPDLGRTADVADVLAGTTATGLGRSPIRRSSPGPVALPSGLVERGSRERRRPHRSLYRSQAPEVPRELAARRARQRRCNAPVSVTEPPQPAARSCRRPRRCRC